MLNQDVYNISLKVSGPARNLIDQFRVTTAGTPLVDFQTPHLTLKRKFSLKSSADEAAVIRVLKAFHLRPLTLTPAGFKKLNDAYVLFFRTANLLEKETELRELLDPIVTSLSPEWEGKNFLPHITIIRDPGNAPYPKLPALIIDTVSFDELCLYRYDSRPTKEYSYEIFSRKLE